MEHWRSTQGEIGESGKHLTDGGSANEPIGEFGDVSRKVFGADVVVAAMQRALDVPQDRIDPGWRRMLPAVRFAFGHERLVKARGALHGREAVQGIGEHECAGFEVALGPSGDLIALECGKTS